MPDLRVPNSDHCLRVLQETPGLLRGLLSLATREQLDWQPNSERWSISMVLAHLAEVETKGFRNRFKAMLEQDQPPLPRYDQLALFRSVTRFDPQAALARFAAERSVTLALLGALPDGAGARPGQHAEFGVITVAQLLNEFAFHDLGHTRQIMELYRSQVFYPEMGPFQGVYQIHP